MSFEKPYPQREKIWIQQSFNIPNINESSTLTFYDFERFSLNIAWKCPGLSEFRLSKYPKLLPNYLYEGAPLSRTVSFLLHVEI